MYANIRSEMCERRNVPLDLRGAKSVRGETWDILTAHRIFCSQKFLIRLFSLEIIGLTLFNSGKN